MHFLIKDLNLQLTFKLINNLYLKILSIILIMIEVKMNFLLLFNLIRVIVKIQM